ncbi:unnamed protein product [Pleuronectes platessa]|uniref:Uncharacterized protein n=1 Tax=Pleuronectes platessa TaxID=8262 RepID=A0A9N7TN54_PLEPL|nr:unnamed protein product [Pleuronectes platessa]
MRARKLASNISRANSTSQFFHMEHNNLINTTSLRNWKREGDSDQAASWVVNPVLSLLINMMHSGGSCTGVLFHTCEAGAAHHRDNPPSDSPPGSSLPPPSSSAARLEHRARSVGRPARWEEEEGGVQWLQRKGGITEEKGIERSPPLPPPPLPPPPAFLLLPDHRLQDAPGRSGTLWDRDTSDAVKDACATRKQTRKRNQEYRTSINCSLPPGAA